MGERGPLGQGRFAAAQVERYPKCQLPEHDGFAGIQPPFVFRDHGQAVQCIEPYLARPRPRPPGWSRPPGGRLAGDLVAVYGLWQAWLSQAIRQPAEFRCQGLQVGPERIVVAQPHGVHYGPAGLPWGSRIIARSG